MIDFFTELFIVRGSWLSKIMTSVSIFESCTIVRHSIVVNLDCLK